ncbi:MAG: hypothetical protein U0169_04880 [Polyangiaceae bacterium]
MDTRSTLHLVPSSPGLSKVRIVSELFDGTSSTWLACDGAAASRGTALVRKVAIATFAEGRLFPFFAPLRCACLGVTECDETTSTCERGRCVSARVSESGGVVDGEGACFDLRACPTLEPMKAGPSPCTWLAPRPASEGYVAVTFRLEGQGGSSPSRGVTVIDPDDVVDRGASGAGRLLELSGTACALASKSAVDGVHFGYACPPPRAGQGLCATDASSASSSATSASAILLGTLDLPVPKADGGTSSPDGSTDASTSPDGTLADGGSDASSADAGGRDGSFADASDASGSDGATTDGSSSEDSGADGSTGEGGGVPGRGVECPVGSGTFCSSQSGTYCCGSTAACVVGATCFVDRIQCDDASDCASGELCCRKENGPYTASVCTTEMDCFGTSAGREVLCSADDTRCPPGSQCLTVRPEAPVARTACVPSLPKIEVRCPLGGSPHASCSGMSSSCCEEPASSNSSSCVSPSSVCPEFHDKWECDDQRDCMSGMVCCFPQVQPRASACVPLNQCLGTSAVVGCSDQDSRCPAGYACGPVDAVLGGSLQRICKANP